VVVGLRHVACRRVAAEGLAVGDRERFLDGAHALLLCTAWRDGHAPLSGADDVCVCAETGRVAPDEVPRGIGLVGDGGVEAVREGAVDSDGRCKANRGGKCRDEKRGGLHVGNEK